MPPVQRTDCEPICGDVWVWLGGVPEGPGLDVEGRVVLGGVAVPAAADGDVCPVVVVEGVVAPPDGAADLVDPGLGGAWGVTLDRTWDTTPGGCVPHAGSRLYRLTPCLQGRSA